MDIRIRTAKQEDYEAAEAIMKQVHKLHVAGGLMYTNSRKPYCLWMNLNRQLRSRPFFVAEGEGR